MTRTLLFRTVAGIAGLAAGLVGPATALVHALEHARSGSVAHHVVPEPDHGAHHHQHDHESPAPNEGSVGSNSADDHPHARLDAGATTRSSAELAPFVVTAQLTYLEPVDPVAVVAEPGGNSLSVVVTATGPPPPSRAPPTI